jgi:hypothetical protein
MKWLIPIATMTAALAAFLFIDHRHTFLLPETLYCSLGLSQYRQVAHTAFERELGSLLSLEQALAILVAIIATIGGYIAYEKWRTDQDKAKCVGALCRIWTTAAREAIAYSRYQRQTG